MKMKNFVFYFALHSAFGNLPSANIMRLGNENEKLRFLFCIALGFWYICTMNVAILLAGGSGSRLGAGLPKQFLRVAGKTILEHTIEAFDSHPLIDEVAIVSRADYMSEVRRLLESGAYTKVRRLLPGGRERYDSSLAALAAYTCDDDCLLFHDAVRPMVSHRIISDCLDALSRYDAVGVGAPTTDTILQVDGEGCISAIPPRATLRNAQTPQGFRRRVIRRAYDLALADPAFTTTDDCGVVHRYLPEVPVYVVEGDPTNIKVTYPSDLQVLEALLTARRDGRNK